MAGMLPGVECARRRRIHQNGGLFDSSSSSGHVSTRRSSFCLYTSSHGSHLSSTSSMERNLMKRVSLDEDLDEAAREAKYRLDERLRAQWKSESKRASNRRERSRNSDGGREMVVGSVHDQEVFGLKRSRSKRFSWAKLNWKSSKQEKCGMWLDQVKVGDRLLHLPCAHMSESRCLVPCLENPTNCPCFS